MLVTLRAQKVVSIEDISVTVTPQYMYSAFTFFMKTQLDGCKMNAQNKLSNCLRTEIFNNYSPKWR